MTQQPIEDSAHDTANEVHVELFIVHPTLVPEDISQTLGLEAHRAHRVGAPQRTPKGTPLSGTYTDTRWRHNVEYRITDRLFAAEVTKLVDRLKPHKAFFAEIKSTGGRASIILQFLNGYQSDEIPCKTLAKLAELELSLGIENFTGLRESG